MRTPSFVTWDVSLKSMMKKKNVLAFVHMIIHCYTLATTTQHDTIAIILTPPEPANYHTIATNVNQFNYFFPPFFLEGTTLKLPLAG